MFEIINNTDKEIIEIEKLESYISFVVKKLKLQKGIFNIIFVNKKRGHSARAHIPFQDRCLTTAMTLPRMRQSSTIIGSIVLFSG